MPVVLVVDLENKLIFGQKPLTLKTHKKRDAKRCNFFRELNFLFEGVTLKRDINIHFIEVKGFCMDF